MTKYVVHGGKVLAAGDQGRAYFETLTAGFEKPRMLMCIFAQPEERWDEKYKYWTNHIDSVLSVKPSYELAQPDTVIEQMARADIIWLYGGDVELLKARVSKIPDFRQALSKMPVVTGASAGALLLTKRVWSCDYRRIIDGLGLVPINTIVHYRSADYSSNHPKVPIDWDQADRELRAAVGPDAEITPLPEGTFKVYEA
ncbi:MAG TPA: hypothetical protein VHB51_01490 [Candidatus Saccharimonadales bacterium]|nr:hypothetical protein [Candidatus Saccharimonadales bacterium]